MGRRASSSPKERHHVHLSKGAWARLDQLYKSQGITPSGVIAQLVDHHIRRVEEKNNLVAPPTEDTDLGDVELSDV